MAQPEHWRAAFADLRDQFNAHASRCPDLRFGIVVPRKGKQSLPPSLAAEYDAAECCERIDPWTPPWAVEPATAALFGPKDEVKAFKHLARQAWAVIPGTADGKAPLSHHTDTDH